VNTMNQPFGRKRPLDGRAGLAASSPPCSCAAGASQSRQSATDKRDVERREEGRGGADRDTGGQMETHGGGRKDRVRYPERSRTGEGQLRQTKHIYIHTHTDTHIPVRSRT
jgi:hypothetical protein